MPSRLVLSAALLGALLGCGTGPDDESVFGTYSLVAVEGSTLPFLDTSDPNCEVSISQGELRLLVSGTFSLEFSGPYDCVGGQTGTLGRVYNGAFTRTSSTVAFESVIPGEGTLHFAGTVGPGTVEMIVPPIPPTTGADLTLGFEIVP
jgi:hypothetical protein